MATRSGRIVLLADARLVLVQRREGVDLHAEDVLFDVVRESLELVRRVDVRRDREDLVELLERERLRLGHEEQDEHEADRVPRRVPPERALRLERAEQPREREPHNEITVCVPTAAQRRREKGVQKPEQGGNKPRKARDQQENDSHER